jgi:anthranilate synthase component 1
MPALRVAELDATPDLTALAAARPDRYPVLFRTTGANAGWDILFACPLAIERVDDAHAWPALAAHPALRARPASRPSPAPQDLPFTGGWVVLASYEFGGLVEPAAGISPGRRRLPLLWLARVPAAVLRESASGRTFLVAESEYGDLVDVLRSDLAALAPVAPAPCAIADLDEAPADAFLDGVAAIQDYIRRGDVFQVNLSRPWRARLVAQTPPARLFARLMQANPAPFSALWQADGLAVVSSSPERLLRVARGGAISTRPIAGTHPRGRDADEDRALRERLIAHPKERAEHIMLVDLERNDLGRVCVPGSVRVEALMDVASYAFVHHIESTVAGRLRPDVRVVDVLCALFPGGTITGCPKIRTMQIIRELEGAPREAYTGSIGYINHDGSMDFNILIRSFQLDGDALHFRAGAGIVADSDPSRELAETRAKAQGLLRALGAA